MIKFYQILLAEKEKISVAIALKQAQNWIKNLTNEDYQKFKAEAQKSNSQLERLIRDSGSRKAIYDGDTQSNQEKVLNPYESPYYWAGFTAAGI